MNDKEIHKLAEEMGLEWDTYDDTQGGGGWGSYYYAKDGSTGQIDSDVFEELAPLINQYTTKARADERKKARALYAKRNPQFTRQWIADYLGISRPTLNKWLNNPEEFTVGAIIKLAELTKEEGKL